MGPSSYVMNSMALYIYIHHLDQLGAALTEPATKPANCEHECACPHARALAPGPQPVGGNQIAVKGLPFFQKLTHY
jgi:hypothetical protein